MKHAVAAPGQGAPGQMTWLKGFRPGFRLAVIFFLLKKIYVYRRGAHINERRSVYQFADSENVKSIRRLDPSHILSSLSPLMLFACLHLNVPPALHFRQ